MIVAPHDLLQIDPTIARTWSAPDWVHRSLARAPWVVVRRAAAVDGAIPIGIRGSQRCERYGAFVRPADVLAVRTPYDLVARIVTSGRSMGLAARPIERAARALDAAALWRGIRWGPTGSYGFELASGVYVTHEASDLDGVVVVTSRETLATFARHRARITAATGVRIDLEVQVRDLGIALEEYLGDAERVLAKTSAGAALVAR